MPDDRDPERRLAELRKLEAETTKLTAETALLPRDEERAAQLAKVAAEAEKAKAEAAKLTHDTGHFARTLESVKAAGTGAALLGGVVALLGLVWTIYSGLGQRADETKKRTDQEFTVALGTLSETEPSKRMTGVISLARFLGPDYDAYHDRAATGLVYRLRLEADGGVRSLIRTTVVRHGGRAVPILSELRQQVVLEVRPLFDDEREPERIRVLQHAFLEASRAISAITKKPIDLSHGRFKRFSFEYREFPNAVFDDASLWHADLFRAVLHDASLKRAILRWANLRRTDLRNADLEEADLICADLWKADLHGVRKLPYTKLTGAAWRDAVLDARDRTELERLYPAPQGSPEHRAQHCARVE
jgi:hypothetical protein